MKKEVDVCDVCGEPVSGRYFHMDIALSDIKSPLKEYLRIHCSTVWCSKDDNYHVIETRKGSLNKMKVFIKKNELLLILTKVNRSRNWLARKAKISSAYMSQLIGGTRNPSPKIRKRIMKALPHCLFDDLFEIAEDKKK